MNLKHLEYIIEISRCGSFHKAADNLYISQPSLSKLVKNLENELGFSIFRRTRKGVEPTENGIRLVEDAVQILEITNNWKNLTNDNETDLKTRIYINAQGILASTLIIDLIENRSNRSPNVSLYFNELFEQPQIKKDESANSVINIFFCEKGKYSEYAQAAADNGYTAKIIDEGKSYVFMNSRNELAEKPYIELKDLMQLPSAEFQSVMPSFYPYADLLEKLNKEKQIHLPNREAVLEIISENKDVISLFSYVVAAKSEYVKKGIIKAVEISDFPMPTLLVIIYKSTSDDNVSKLIEQIKGFTEDLH